MSLKKRIAAGVIAAMSCLTMAIPSISASAASTNLVGKTVGEAMPVIIEHGMLDDYGIPLSWVYSYCGDTYINATKYNDYLKEIGQYAAKNRSTLDIDNDGVVEYYHSELNDDQRTAANAYANNYTAFTFINANNYTAFINMVGRSGILSKYGANAYRTNFARIENCFRNYTADKFKNGITVWDTIPKSIYDADVIKFIDGYYFQAFFDLGNTIGDVNYDGVITSTDATLLANYVQNTKPYYDYFDSTAYTYATGIDVSDWLFRDSIADVNADGKINLNDVSEIGRYAATHK